MPGMQGGGQLNAGYKAGEFGCIRAQRENKKRGNNNRNRPKSAWPIIQSQKLNVGLLSMHYAAACLFIADMIDIGFFQDHFDDSQPCAALGYFIVRIIQTALQAYAAQQVQMELKSARYIFICFLIAFITRGISNRNTVYSKEKNTAIALTADHSTQ